MKKYCQNICILFFLNINNTICEKNSQGGKIFKTVFHVSKIIIVTL